MNKTTKIIIGVAFVIALLILIIILLSKSFKHSPTPTPTPTPDVSTFTTINPPLSGFSLKNVKTGNYLNVPRDNGTMYSNDKFTNASWFNLLSPNKLKTNYNTSFIDTTDYCISTDGSLTSFIPKPCDTSSQIIVKQPTGANYVYLMDSTSNNCINDQGQKVTCNAKDDTQKWVIGTTLPNINTLPQVQGSEILTHTTINGIANEKACLIYENNSVLLGDCNSANKTQNYPYANNTFEIMTPDGSACLTDTGASSQGMTTGVCAANQQTEEGRWVFRELTRDGGKPIGAIQNRGNGRVMAITDTVVGGTNNRFMKLSPWDMTKTYQANAFRTFT